MPEAREEPSYILWDTGQKKIPPRPESPADFPPEDARHWYDYEYAGWGVEKVEIPESTGDGAQGKHIILLNGQVPHPYFVEFTAAMGGIARTYGIELKVQYAYWDSRQQSRQVDKAIAEAPDTIIPVSGSAERRAEVKRQLFAADSLVFRVARRRLSARMIATEAGNPRILNAHRPAKGGSC